MSTAVATIGAVLLAGGRASRVDGAAKPLFTVDGKTLLARAVEAASSAGADPITVVGPPTPGHAPRVTWVREDPPFGGPAAATVAALETWQANGTLPEWMLLLACDLPRADAVVARLRADIVLFPSDTDGLCLADPAGRPQWLSGIYRTAAVLATASALPNRGRNAPARALFDDLAIAVVSVDADIVGDIDTWDDLARAQAGNPSNEGES